jgi:hypothetical protein
MALVPFRVTGPSAAQDMEERLLQVGPCSLLLQQRPQASGNTAHLLGQQQQQQQQQHGGSTTHQQQRPDLSNVGLVLWQSGLLLADFLLLRMPHGAAGTAEAAGAAAAGAGSSAMHSWAGVRVLELGCGGGTTGMFLAKAGAQVGRRQPEALVHCVCVCGACS